MQAQRYTKEKKRDQTGKFRSMWRLNNTLLNNTWIKEEMPRKTGKYFELNENTIYQNLQDTVKTALRGKFMALNAYIRKEENLKSII